MRYKFSGHNKWLINQLRFIKLSVDINDFIFTALKLKRIGKPRTMERERLQKIIFLFISKIELMLQKYKATVSHQKTDAYEQISVQKHLCVSPKRAFVYRNTLGCAYYNHAHPCSLIFNVVQWTSCIRPGYSHWAHIWSN